MKTSKITSLKKVIYLSLSVLFLTSACAQSETKQASTPSQKTTSPAPDGNIHMAVLSGNLAAVMQHIEAGADINEKDAMSGSTPLNTAASFNKPEIVKALIKAKADLSIKNNDGSTALHSAAFFGRIEIVQLLLDANADKTLRNNFGATPREAVMAEFVQMKPVYDMLKQQLGPLGFQLDLAELEKARPVIAMMLQ